MHHLTSQSKHTQLSTKEETKKQQIIDNSIEFFSQNGIWDSKIDDIIRFLGIGKGTLYRYFQNKKDLLLHCIARLTTFIVPEEVLEDIQKESDPRARMRIRFCSFLKGFPNISSILSLANQGLQSNDPDLERQAKKTYQMFVAPLIKDFISDKKNELIRDIDEETMAYLILGMGQSMGNLLKINTDCTPEELADMSLDFVFRAIGLPENEIHNQKIRRACWKICDLENQTKHLLNISFNDEAYFSGNSGKWELQIPLENIASIALQNSGNESFSATVNFRNEQSRILTVAGNTLLSGEAELGKYRIQLREIALVCFVGSDKRET